MWLWDTRIGSVSRVLNADYSLGSAFSPDGRLLASLANLYCTTWHVEAGVSLSDHGAISLRIKSLSFLPDSIPFATAGEFDTIVVWDAKTGEPCCPSLVHSS